MFDSSKNETCGTRLSTPRSRSLSSSGSARLENQTQVIAKGREALGSLLSYRSPKMPASVSQATLSTKLCPQQKDHCSNDKFNLLRQHESGAISACPFASMKAVVGESRTTWSPYGSITPRPESIITSPKHVKEDLRDLLSYESVNPPEKVQLFANEEPCPVQTKSTSDNGQDTTSHKSFKRTFQSGHEGSIDDPIAAESRFVGSYPPPSTSGSAAASKCPIRYLDQHSPEEVAEYFENHKHEIPRSHAICIKRYQSNEESIKQLDAKYGNLVSMIQGLGAKHQSLLAIKEGEQSSNIEQNSIEKVERWADDVKPVTENVTVGESEDAEMRESHFARPLKEVRLGESPSRPWGISIPVAPGRAKHSAPPRSGSFSYNSFDDDAKRDSGNSDTSRSAARKSLSLSPSFINPTSNGFLCPHRICASSPSNEYPKIQQLADHINIVHGGDDPALKPPAADPVLEGKSKNVPQMLFTGPVFIGYPAEQAAMLMQQWGMGNSVPMS